MCTVLLPPGDNPIAVNKYIISYHTISYHIPYHIYHSYHIIYISSYHIVSYTILYITSYSYHISYHTISYHIPYYISYHIHIIYHIIPYRIIYHIIYYISYHIHIIYRKITITENALQKGFVAFIAEFVILKQNTSKHGVCMGKAGFVVARIFEG